MGTLEQRDSRSRGQGAVKLLCLWVLEKDHVMSYASLGFVFFVGGVAVLVGFLNELGRDR